MSSLAGQTFAGYEIIAKLGQGGMGAVYKARQTKLDRLAALKIMASDLASDPDFVARFRREAAAAANLSHPNVVQVYSAGESEGTHYIAMEFVDGQTLRDHIAQHGRLDPREAIAITVYVAEALQYAWNRAKLIHRDIKPENIFLSKAGEVKVGDLGLAKTVGGQTTSLTQTGTAMGSPHYISPEQATGAKEMDFRTDIYSLGGTLYHMLTGQTPYSGDSSMVVMMKHVNDPPPAIFKVWPQCPMPLGLLVGKMLAKNRNSRPASYEELIEQLRALHDKLKPATVPAAAPVSPSDPTQLLTPTPKPAPKARKSKPVTRNSGLVIGGAVAAAVLLLGGLLLWSPWKNSSSTTQAERDQLQPGAIRLWDSPDEIPREPGRCWENNAIRLDGGSLVDRKLKNRDAMIRADIRMNPDADGPQVCLRHQPDETGIFYRLAMKTNDGSLELASVRGHKTTARLNIWPLPRVYGPDEWACVELRAVGDDLIVTVDGQKVGTVHDTSQPQAGNPMLFAKANGYFRNVVYVPLDKPGHAASPKFGVLFDGRDTSAWQQRDGGDCQWEVKDGVLVAGKGDLDTREKFQDFKLHVEFAVPRDAKQGNSGIYLQGRYELQIIDSFGSPAGGTGGCGAIFGLLAPTENASKPPDEWQSFDITFRAAQFDASDAKTANARISVVHNGKLIHDNVEIPKSTGKGEPESAAPGPIRLQSYGSPVRFRNISIRPVDEAAAQAVPEGFVSLFNGKDLTGWEGRPEFWSVQDGAICGRTTHETPAKRNTFLVCTAGEFSDFELRAQFKLAAGDEKGIVNSGVQYRSRVVDREYFMLSGYQADLGFRGRKNLSGTLWEEDGRSVLADSGRRVVLREGESPTTPQKAVESISSARDVRASYRDDDWNDLVIIASGNRLQHYLNGKLAVDVTDETAAAAKTGTLALQIMAGPPMQVWFRNLLVKKLAPATSTGDAAWVPLDISAACNRSTIAPESNKPVHQPFGLTGNSWVTTGWLRARGSDKTSVPDDGRVAIPGANPTGFFQLRVGPGDDCILLSIQHHRRDRGRDIPTTVTMDVPASQQRKFARLAFLHASEPGDAEVSVTFHYDIGDDGKDILHPRAWARDRRKEPLTENETAVTASDASKHPVDMMAETLPVDPQRVLKSLTFTFASVSPKCKDLLAAEKCRAGIFAISALPAAPNTPTLQHSTAPATADAAWQNAINLLPLIDPQQDAVEGKWSRVDDGLTSDIVFGARLQLPYQPPEEYDFQISFTRLNFQMKTRYSGWGDTNLILAKNGRQFKWFMGAHGNTWFGYDIVNGQRFDKNPTGVKVEECLQLNRRYTSRVEVRKDSVKAYLDDKLITTWKPEYGPLQEGAYHQLPNKKVLGIGSCNVQTVFHSVEVREVAGKGTFTRPAP
ncbi:MAG: DUF1080 domain-containing protein [Verrucomicrobia bacterium]|nr:DUF1080 domain-containing protein [Verrucomicrobiota bacterium]